MEKFCSNSAIAMKYLISILFLLLAQVAFGASYYVATTGSDSNIGSQASPFLTIQKAANVVAAGDTVFIRGGTYASSSLIGLVTSGTSGSPITWKPEPATGTPVIRYSGAKQYDHAIIEAYCISYNIFQDLTFGGPSGSLTDQALKFYACNSPDFNGTTSDSRGNEVRGNTFSNIGHDGTGGAAFSGIISMGGPQDSVVDRNTFTGNYGIQIVMAGGYKNAITNNTISGMLGAQLYGDYVYPASAHGIWVSSSEITWTPGSNLKKAGYTLVQGNTVNGGSTALEKTGVRCDAGAHNMTIRDNYIYDLGTTNDTAGIYLESRCRNNLVLNNLVVNSRRGVILSNPSIGSTQYDQIIANTFYGNWQGVYVSNAGHETIANNIGAENSKSQIVVDAISVAIGSITLSNNLWFKTATSNIGQWNCATNDCDTGNATQTLAQFDAASGEVNSLNSDPLFVDAGSSNFNLTSTSPAIDAGSATYFSLYNGTAPDLGVFERFGVINCEVGEVATNKLVCNFQMNTHQPIQITNTTGWSWTGGTLSSVAVTGAAQLTFTLSGAYGGGASTITYNEATGNGKDTALLGNSISQRLSGISAFTVTDNIAAPPPGSVNLSHWRVYLLQGATDTAWTPAMNCSADSTNCIVAPGSKLWVRFKLRNNSGSNYAAFNLVDRWRYNGGSYVALTDNYVNNIKVLGTSVQLGTVLSHGTLLTQDTLTSNEATNVSCYANRIANNIPALTLNNSSETECARAIDISTSAAVGDTFEMCPYRDDGVALTCSTPLKLTIGSYQYVR